MKPLTDTQKKILTAASKDPHQPVEDHMTHIKSPAIRRQITYSMLCSGYVIADDDNGDRHYITGEGIEALGAKKAKAAKPEKKVKQKQAPKAATGKAKKTAEPKAKKPAKKAASVEAPDADTGKPAKGRQLMITLLSREEGATNQQMADATGWQKGAIFGTLSKIKKQIAERNQTIVSEKDGKGARVYKITEQPAVQRL